MQLHDEAASGVKGALCSAEVRLDGSEGSTLVRLDHVVTRQRRGRQLEHVRQLAVRFAFSTEVGDAADGEEAAYVNPARAGSPPKRKAAPPKNKRLTTS